MCPLQNTIISYWLPLRRFHSVTLGHIENMGVRLQKMTHAFSNFSWCDSLSPIWINLLYGVRIHTNIQTPLAFNTLMWGSVSLTPTSANHLTCPHSKDDQRTTVLECCVAISPWRQIVNNIVMPWKARSKTIASSYAMSRQVWGQGHCVTWRVLSQMILWRLGIPSPAVSPTYLCNFETETQVESR